MKSNLALAPTLSTLVFCLVAASASAQGQDPKYVVIDNVSAIPGQAAVDGHVAIPLEPATKARFDPTTGNIIVKCEKGAHGAESGACSNIGNVGSNDAPPAPGNPNLTLTPGGVVGATGARLTWSSSGAAFCYGVSAVPVGAGPAVSGWAKEWPASTTTGFSLDSLFNSMAANTTATYNFTLRCYSSATGTVGSTPVVAYVQPAALQVELNKPAGGVSGDWCDAYLDTLSPTERAEFEAYRAENRGFTAVNKTFTTQTGRVLGVDTGSIGPSGAPVLPGKVSGNNYLAMSFSMPAASQSNTGKFILNFNLQNAVGVQEHPIIATISPCAGDFRPRGGITAEAYRIGWCRTNYQIANHNIRGNSAQVSDQCYTPPNKTMYINVSLRDMYQPGNASGPNGVPEDYCGAGLYCGASGSLQK